jgi:DNA ligase-1
MLFADVVAASAAVAATRSRRTKVAVLAELLRAAAGAEIGVITAVMAGTLRQGRIGIGWRTMIDAETTPAAEPSLTVLEVDTALTELAAIAGPGSTARRKAALLDLFSRSGSAEQRLLFRLLTGELRQGALEGVMTEAIAAAAELPLAPVRRAFMLSGRLATTAEAALTEGVDALDAFGIELGRPVRPMLASPADSVQAAVDELGEVSVEFKLDGARIQIHRDGPRVWVFTRTLRDITDSVPELVELVRALPCDRAVFDGETLALTEDGKPRTFAETMSRFGATSEREVLLRPYFFDLLHVDGTDLLDLPLSRRRAELRRVAPDFLITDGASLEVAIAAGHEGVVVKALDSGYAAGRRGRAWQKVKPVHTLDLVVLAAEWGHGRRTGSLSNLHLGARDPDGGEPIMVGKTFKGMTDDLLRWQTVALQQIERDRSEWTVQVRPEFVVEIAVDGAQRSSRYPGGVALRFARVVRYRPDKTPAEADTIDAVRALLLGS